MGKVRAMVEEARSEDRYLFSKFLDDIETAVSELIGEASCVTPSLLGLDPRCADRLYITEEFVAVDEDEDRLFQFYSMFLTSPEAVTRVGGYVFYNTDLCGWAFDLSMQYSKRYEK